MLVWFAAQANMLATWKVREHWFTESRREILTIVLVKTTLTMWCRGLDPQCFPYLSI